MNYEKVNLQKRVAGQYDRYSPREYDHEAPDWPLMPFGQYKGLTLPAVFFINPGYFRSLPGTFKATTNTSWKLRNQAIIIAHLTKHILPPGPERSDREFLILEDANGRSAGFVVARRGQKPKSIRGSGLVVADRVETLDMAFARDFDDAEHAYAEFGKSLRQVFFKDRGRKPTFDGYMRFLTNQDNFDVERWKGLTRKGNRRSRRYRRN